jgi:hypothetical protein
VVAANGRGFRGAHRSMGLIVYFLDLGLEHSVRDKTFSSECLGARFVDDQEIFVCLCPCFFVVVRSLRPSLAFLS